MCEARGDDGGKKSRANGHGCHALGSYGGTCPGHYDHGGTFDESFSHLHTLSLNPDSGFELDCNKDYGIPWHQIRHLRITEQPRSIQKYLNILKKCGLLEDCELNITINLNDEELNEPPAEIQNISLPDMRRLSIQIYCFNSTPHDDIDTFLRSLVLSNLQSLSIGISEQIWSAADDASIYHRLSGKAGTSEHT